MNYGRVWANRTDRIEADSLTEFQLAPFVVQYLGTLKLSERLVLIIDQLVLLLIN